MLFIPLGFNEPLVGEIRKLGPRAKRYSWAFAGNLKGSRGEMLKAFEHIPPSSVVTNTAGFMRDLPISDADVAEMYSSSHFVLCPFGSLSPDTWRIMEALEAGAIPVSVKMKGLDYFRYVFGNHPFIVADNWEHAAESVQTLLIDPPRLRAAHETVQEWYVNFTARLSADLINLLSGDSTNIQSEQFRYQKHARWNPWVRFVFWLHFRWPSVSKHMKHQVDKLHRLWVRYRPK